MNDGTIANAGSAHAEIEIGVVNNGVINDTNIAGGIDFAAPMLNNGTVSLTNGEISLGNTISGGVVSFNGAGLLDTAAPNGFAGGVTVANFGQGDRIGLTWPNSANSLSFSNGTLDVAANGTLLDSMLFSGNLVLGNFQLNNTSAPGASSTSLVMFAPNDGGSNVDSAIPDISAPISAGFSQGGTITFGDVSIANAPTLTLDISVTNGTLFMNGATGSGTNHLSISTPTAESQINADLQSLTYTPASGASSDAIKIVADASFASSGTTESLRYIPITILGIGPTLNEPSSETVSAGGTQAVSGSYSDSFAAGNPGSLFLGISDSSGTLSAKDASGNAVAGSGTNSITLNTDYTDLNAVLNSLTYTAGAASGSDSISFDVWNQAGTETRDTVPVTITGSGGGGPTLNEPSSESVAVSGTVAVSGSYSDNFAQGNPGSLFLGISDGSGTLSAIDASGNAAAGSGSNSIAVNTDYVDLNAILSSLHYTAGGSPGSDTIHFDVWNQAGVETTGNTAVTIGSSTPSATMSQADFAATNPMPNSGTLTTNAGSGSANTMMLSGTTQPTGIPLLPGQ